MSLKCDHQWILSISTTPQVFCSRCYVQFKPDNQQVPYWGVVPQRFK